MVEIHSLDSTSCDLCKLIGWMTQRLKGGERGEFSTLNPQRGNEPKCVGTVFHSNINICTYIMHTHYVHLCRHLHIHYVH